MANPQALQSDVTKVIKCFRNCFNIAPLAKAITARTGRFPIGGAIGDLVKSDARKIRKINTGFPCLSLSLALDSRRIKLAQYGIRVLILEF